LFCIWGLSPLPGPTAPEGFDWTADLPHHGAWALQHSVSPRTVQRRLKFSWPRLAPS